MCFSNCWRYITFFILLLIFSGCIKSSTFQYIKLEYSDKKHFYTKILVLSLSNQLLSKQDQLSISNGKKVNPLLMSRQELAYFNNYMGPIVSEVAIAEVLGIDPSFKTKEMKFKYFKVDPEKAESFYLFSPDSGQIVYRDVIPDYVLFLEDLYFLKDFKEEMSVIGRGSSSKYTLETGIEYLIWDNKKQTVAAYGKLSHSLNLFDYPSKDNYLNILESFAFSIFSKSPIAFKQVK